MFFFTGKDGIYYDLLGDDIFTAERIDDGLLAPVYRLNFGDVVLEGIVIDNEHNFYLDKLP